MDHNTLAAGIDEWANGARDDDGFYDRLIELTQAITDVWNVGPRPRPRPLTPGASVEEDVEPTTSAVSSAADPHPPSPARGLSSSFSHGSPALPPSPQPLGLSPSFPEGTPAASPPQSPKQSSPEPPLPPSTPARSELHSTTPTAEPPPSPTPSVPRASSADQSLPPPPPKTPSSKKKNGRRAEQGPTHQELTHSATALVASAKFPESSMRFYDQGPNIVDCCRQVLQSTADSTIAGEVTAETLKDLKFTRDVLVFLSKIFGEPGVKAVRKTVGMLRNSTGQRPNFQPAITEKPSNVPAELQLCLNLLHANLHLFAELKNAELLPCKSATRVARVWHQIKLRLNAKDPEYVEFIKNDPDMVMLKKHKPNRNDDHLCMGWLVLYFRKGRQHITHAIVKNFLLRACPDLSTLLGRLRPVLQQLDFEGGIMPTYGFDAIHALKADPLSLYTLMQTTNNGLEANSSHLALEDGTDGNDHA
ncbi:uncharacterized protein J3D65DRAFT_672319 [Phyllosticta citribraziliensis]|uniref:Uncharacterized protein n=1 Tax=Phyllosticta citribraziliensis TaxID=989973 RepID=A0ABR1L3W6_9PEZI